MTAPAATTRGLWLAASRLLGRDVPTSDPYPHVCGVLYPARPGGRPYRVKRRDCGACCETWHPASPNLRRHPLAPSGVGCCPLPEGHWVHDVPDRTDDQRALDERRTGDR